MAEHRVEAAAVLVRILFHPLNYGLIQWLETHSYTVEVAG